MAAPGSSIALAQVVMALFLVLLIGMLLLALVRYVRARGSYSSSKNYDMLSHGIEALMAEMRTLKQQLLIKERFAALGELSAAIIHQVRNPLSVMAGYAKLLYRALEEEDPRRGYAKAILDEVEAINQIMEALIGLSKTEISDKRALQLKDILGEVLIELGEAGLKVLWQVFDVRILGDRLLLKQALKNVIQNAIEAGDRVLVKEVEPEHHNTVSLEVSDNGPGIPEEERSKIFMPFYSKKANGLGIGLTLAQKIFFLHGGSIVLKETSEKGTTFLITLPKA